MNFYQDLLVICAEPQVHITASNKKYDDIWPLFMSVYSSRPWIINMIQQLQQISSKAYTMQQTLKMDGKNVSNPDIYKECRDIYATIMTANNSITMANKVTNIISGQNPYLPIDLMDAYEYAYLH